MRILKKIRVIGFHVSWELQNKQRDKMSYERLT